MSSLSQFIHDTHTDNAQKLQHLLANYNDLSDDTRMAQSKKINEQLIDLMRLEANEIFPAISTVTSMADLDRIRQSHKTIESMLTRQLMVHVDEPRQEYLEKLNELQNSHNEWHRVDAELLLPQIKANANLLKAITPEQFMKLTNT